MWGIKQPKAEIGRSVEIESRKKINVPLLSLVYT